MDGIELADRAPPRAVVRGTELADLTLLFEPGVMLVTAPTSPGSGALLHAASLAEAGLQQTAVKVRTPDGHPELALLEQFSAGNRDHAREWVMYLEEVIAVFAVLLGTRTVGVRQVVADGPHCPRFHVDRVPARGVLNVLGPCTEWASDADVDRSRLGHAGGPDDATSGLLRHGSRLEHAEPGELMVFKGTQWPGAAEQAVVHRSPPPNGSRRVLLTLDWLE